MRRLVIILAIAISFNANAQLCDSLVPILNVDLTGANAGTVWVSPPVTRNGNCCTASGFDRCIQFIVTTDSNTCAITMDYDYVGAPGYSAKKLCCGIDIPLGELAYVNAGVHYVTFCKPGNSATRYYITSITNCSTGGAADTPCAVTTNINNSELQVVISVFPNPVRGAFKIKTPKSRNFQLEVFNSLGEKIYSAALKDEDIELNAKPGIYFVHVGDGEKSYTQKLVFE